MIKVDGNVRTVHRQKRSRGSDVTKYQKMIASQQQQQFSSHGHIFYFFLLKYPECAKYRKEHTVPYV